MADSQHSAAPKKANRWGKYIDWEQYLWMLMLSSADWDWRRHGSKEYGELHRPMLWKSSYNQMYFWVVCLSVKRWNESLCIYFGSLKIYATYATSFWKWLCTSTDFPGKQYGLIICWLRRSAKMRFVIAASDTGLASFCALFQFPHRALWSSNPQYLTREGCVSFKTWETAQTHSKLKY